MASISVGNIDTRATNQDCRRNSSHANGLRGINTKVSNAIAKKPPTAVAGLAAADHAVTRRCLVTSPRQAQHSRDDWRSTTHGGHAVVPNDLGLLRPLAVYGFARTNTLGSTS
jgi:hypothetical protein